MNLARFILLVTILLTCGVNQCCSVRLALYANANYSGYLENVVVSFEDEKNCTKLDQSYEVKSMRTDKCVVLYETEDCRRFGLSKINETEQIVNPKLYSFRVANNTPAFEANDFTYSYPSDVRKVHSFHVCSQEMGGGPRLDVDLYNGTDYNGNILQSWRGVCNCENVKPRFLNGISRLSFDNHGNSVVIYKEYECNGESGLLPAGDSDQSRGLFNGHFGEGSTLIKSFQLANPKDCMQLNASIYKFIFSNGTNNGEVKSKNVTIGVTQTLFNNGALPISQAMEFHTTMDLICEYTLANAFKSLHNVKAHVPLQLESSGWLPKIFDANLQFGLEGSYYNGNDTEEKNENKKIISESVGIKFITIVNVASCETCEVSGSVEVRKDFKINYKALAIVDGISGDQKMTAVAIRARLPPGMKYIRDNDEYSVQVSVKSNMKTQVVSRTLVRHDCSPVPNCRHPVQTLSAQSRSTPEIEVPFEIEVNDEDDGEENNNEEVIENLRYSGGEHQIGMPISPPGKFHVSALSESNLFY